MTVQGLGPGTSELSNEANRASSGARRAFQRLVNTTDAVWPTILRVTLGGVMLPHAAQKTLGVFGGLGFAQTMGWLTGQLHLPTVVAVLVIIFEQAGSLALLLGLFTRAAAVAIGIVMIGAVFSVHFQNGFFMNWFGTQAGEGFEFHLLVLAMVAALILGGGGRASFDRILSRDPQ
ncbi:MAG TPA: DoxX family protein [Polyangiaceae bacterium]|jgi:putative oxidoreductase